LENWGKGGELFKFLEDRLFIFFLKRALNKIDQWGRWKILSKNTHWYIDISMQDDGYKYDEIT